MLSSFTYPLPSLEASLKKDVSEVMPTQIDPELQWFHKQLLLVVTERIYRVKKGFSRLKDFKRICISKLVDTLKICPITVILL